jgi:hypothetical protein
VPSFVVDPILCTTPETADPSEVARWLAALEAWLAAREASPFEWRHFFDCTEKIEGLGRFPAFEALRAARRIGELDVNIPTLLQRLARFFQNEAHDLRGITTTRAAVVVEAEPAILPLELLARNAPDVRGGLRDGLLCLACDKTAGEPFAREMHLVTLPFADRAKEVSVAGTIALVDPEEMAKRLGTQAVAESFPTVFSPDALAEFDYEALLAGGEEALAALLTSLASSRHPGSRPLALSLGSHFWESLHRTSIVEDRFATRKLLGICAALLAGRLDALNVDRRPKRATSAPDAPQQTRSADKAKAWRLTITKAGAGYRLHYWHVPADGEHGERIELANILRETDPVVIPET